jgi:hypothetical protein
VIGVTKDFYWYFSADNVIKVTSGFHRLTGLKKFSEIMTKGKGWIAVAFHNRLSPKRLGHHSRIGLLTLTIVFSAIIVTGYAADMRDRIGNRPNVDLLERSLRVGQSTRADVFTALGQPSGKGRVMLPSDSMSRMVWSYYYAEAAGKDVRRIFLFVYFDGDRYDGYLWFSSLPKRRSGDL